MFSFTISLFKRTSDKFCLSMTFERKNESNSKKQLEWNMRNQMLQRTEKTAGKAGRIKLRKQGYQQKKKRK